MRVLFLIVARGGSKGIPGKNLTRIGGISLVGFMAISARRSKYCSRLIISTDSPEIQDEARRHGAEVLFTRPAELASDTASTEQVMWHAADYMSTHTNEIFDWGRPASISLAVSMAPSNIAEWFARWRMLTARWPS